MLSLPRLQPPHLIDLETQSSGSRVILSNVLLMLGDEVMLGR